MFGPPFSPSDPRGVPHILDWFSSPTVTLRPSGVIPVGVVPSGIARPPLGVSGVAHMRSARSSAFRLKSLLPAALFPFCAGVPAIGVGHDKDPLPFVRAECFARRE